MRAEEKIDPELELAEDHDQVEVLEEQHAPDIVMADEVDTSTIHFHELVAYLDALLRGDSPRLELRWASDLEQQALAMVRDAIDGVRGESIQQLLAEDRLEMLNQALAALQPSLAVAFETANLEARSLYDRLAEEIVDFKSSLVSLSDAQEELFLLEKLPSKAKPVDPGEVGDDRPSTLAGPGPAVDQPAPPSTLAGPGPAVERPVVPTTLTGPGPAVEKLPLPSAAWDGDPDAPPARPRR
jgi:hypothetical protein